jgi:hypothetical protein
LLTKHTTRGYLDALAAFLKTAHAEDVRTTILDLDSRELPSSTIDRAVLENASSKPSGHVDADGEEAPDDIETLFIRINSAGTPPAGEFITSLQDNNVFERGGHRAWERGGTGLVLVRCQQYWLAMIINNGDAITDERSAPQFRLDTALRTL